MMVPTIERRIKEIVSEQLGVDEVDLALDSNFVEDLGADSLDIVELVMAMEEEFEIEISDGDAEEILTLRDAVEYVMRKTQ